MPNRTLNKKVCIIVAVLEAYRKSKTYDSAFTLASTFKSAHFPDIWKKMDPVQHLQLKHLQAGSCSNQAHRVGFPELTSCYESVEATRLLCMAILTGGTCTHFSKTRLHISQDVAQCEDQTHRVERLLQSCHPVLNRPIRSVAHAKYFC